MSTNLNYEEKSLPNSITKIRWPYGKNDTMFSYGEHRIIEDSIFAATVKGVSYLGTLDDFKLDDIAESGEFNKEMPIASTPIDLYERRSVYSNGELLWENKSPVDFSNVSTEEVKRRKLMHFATYKEVHYAIFLGAPDEDGLFCIPLNNVAYNEYFKVHPWKEDEVMECAKEYSALHNCPCLVAKRMYCCNWH